jgi:hypothetical protein
MKEVIMKNIISLLVLICSVAVIIVSCAKKEESTTAAAAATPTGGSGSTPSGTLEGNSDLTGTFHIMVDGGAPVGGCIDNSTIISNFGFPSETKSFKYEWIITSTSTITQSKIGYSDATCSTMTSYFNIMDTIEISTEVSSLTAGSNPAFPTTANKIKFRREGYALMANTPAMIASHLTTYVQTVVSGIELLVDPFASDVPQYNLIATGTVSGMTNEFIFIGGDSSADNKSDWNGKNLYWK